MVMDSSMMDGDSIEWKELAVSAASFAAFPGTPPDTEVKEFLDRFPLTVLFSSLQKEEEVPGIVESVVAAFERILKSPYAITMLPEFLPYAHLGLSSRFPSIRHLTCLVIGKALEKNSIGKKISFEAILEFDVLVPLLNALLDENTGVAKAASKALENLAETDAGLELLFTNKGVGVGRLKEMAWQGSALVQVRILSLVAAIFGLSEKAAALVEGSNIISVLAVMLDNTSDALAHINYLDILSELAASQNGVKFLLHGNFIDQLIALIRNFEVDTVIRSHAMRVGARLILSVGMRSTLPGTSKILEFVDAITKNIANLNDVSDTSGDVQRTEKAVAVDCLGLIGKSSEGAELLLRVPNPAAQYIVTAVVLDKASSVKLAGIHALASIAGSEHLDTSLLLSEQAETSLHDLIYSALDASASHVLSDLLWALLQQAPEMRHATYRLLIPLVARKWCLWEVCSHKDLISFITDPQTEAEKEGMEWRHAFCVATSTALAAASHQGDEMSKAILEQLDAAVRRGPYLAKEQVEARPIVATQERF